MPQAYFTFAEQIFHVEDISLVPQERISLKKALAFTSAFFSPRLSPRLRSLPRRRKQSTGLFSSVAYAPPSLFESLATKIKKHRAQRCCTLYFFGGEQGILSRRCRAYRLAALVATSAKTVRRTVFFRHCVPPSLFESLATKIKKHRAQRCCTLRFLAESKGFEPSKPCLRLTRFPIVLLRPARTTLRITRILYIIAAEKSSVSGKNNDFPLKS